MIKLMKIAALGLMTALLMTAPGAALAADDTTELKGMILSHEGSTIVVRTTTGDTTVTLTDATKIRGTSGSLGIRGEDHPASDLIRGLAVTVDVAQMAGGPTATEVTFKNSDLKTAQQIAAGLHVTEGNVAQNREGIEANAERIDNVGELMAVGRAKVFFAVGSATITPKGKQDLETLVNQAKSIKGYRLAVVGRADPTGNAEANKRLSLRRAAAVNSYLLENLGVLPGRILPMTALGESPIAQDLDPPKSDAEARRVTVTIAVSKSSQKPTPTP